MVFLTIHNHGTAIMPIVSSRGAVAYGMAKVLASVIRPFTGWYPHHIKNTQHFMEQTKSLTLQQGKCMVSYEVKTLNKSILVDPCHLNCKSKLLQDPFLSYWTSMSIPQIFTLLMFCLKNTYFFFLGKHFEQVHGTAMGYPN